MPFLEFGNIFLLNNCETGIAKIQKTQNKCLRFILKKDRMYSSELVHRDARLETLKVRALTAAMKLMFKFKFNEDNLMEPINDERIATRSNRGPIFKLDYPNSNRFLNLTAYQLRKEWNKLPYSIRHIQDYDHFKMVIKRYFKGQYVDHNSGGVNNPLLSQL